MTPPPTPIRCRVCNIDAHLVPRENGQSAYNCVRCGTYVVHSVNDYISGLSSRQVANLSSLLCEYESTGELPVLDDALVERAKSARVPLIPTRANLLLRYLYRNSSMYLAGVSTNTPRLLSETWSEHDHDVSMLINLLDSRGLLNQTSLNARLTPIGWIEGEALGQQAAPGIQCFVAMWFNEVTNAAFQNGIRPAIENAGYAPLRIDSKEHTNKIDDEIIAEIRRSRFLVADFTGHRGGVYFEAGFAMGLNIPVFFTCRHDQINDLHFDIRQYNTIAWTDEADLKTRLQNRIAAVIGEGPKARN